MNKFEIFLEKYPTWQMVTAFMIIVTAIAFIVK